MVTSGGSGVIPKPSSKLANARKSRKATFRAVGWASPLRIGCVPFFLRRGRHGAAATTNTRHLSFTASFVSGRTRSMTPTLGRARARRGAPNTLAPQPAAGARREELVHPRIGDRGSRSASGTSDRRPGPPTNDRRHRPGEPRSDALARDQRQHAGDERERRHQDRPQTDRAPPQSQPPCCAAGPRAGAARSGVVGPWRIRVFLFTMPTGPRATRASRRCSWLPPVESAATRTR